jgi:hypothetical protein
MLMAQRRDVFVKLLPAFYHKSLITLAAGSSDAQIRQAIADLLDHLQNVYRFLDADDGNIA